MTWGSNCSGKMDCRCPWCGERMCDDRDRWPTSHMDDCRKRPWFGRWGKLSGVFTPPTPDSEKEKK